MSERIFWCEAVKVGEVELDAEESRHARQSLRLNAGDSVTLLDGKGGVGRGVLADDRSVEPRRSRANLRVRVESLVAVTQPEPRLTLLVAACKGERLDWMIEKCTELGVPAIWLTEFERSVAQPGAGRVDRLSRLARQACKQCRRAWLPDIRSGAALDANLAALAREPSTLLVTAHPETGIPRFGEVLQDHRSRVHAVAVVIGPEGGLSLAEIERLRASGRGLVRLSANILRVETAAVAAASIWAECASPPRETAVLPGA
ncbi:MAG: 16S rRNA (uracil(1498)-N(3))-methyltransferase [Planctomycetes bacterium]|nr:16S rRNA (uracil(1498)-N(3))-methyltransferase [Planctomycetota bacterium]